MKRKEKWLKGGLLVALCIGLYAFQVLKNAPVSMTLEEAIQKKMVNCRYTSNGQYSGESVELSITNLSGTPLQISIPVGTVFKPNDEGDQDLIVVEQQVIALNSKATGKQTLDGFCMEANDHAPTPENGMKLSKTTNQKLKDLATHINGKGYDKDMIQSAVWIVSNGHSIGDIDQDSEKGKALRTYLSTLTGQKDPWYETTREHVVREDRVIENNPISVNGKIQFVSDGKIKIHEVVQKVNGEVKNTSSEIEFPRQGKWNYQFTLTVKGWEKGNYEVKVMDGNNKVLETFPFTI